MHADWCVCVCVWVQGLSSVTAAMTDGPFEIGDRVVSLSSSSQGAPLGLKGLVRCPGILCDKATCFDMAYTERDAPLGWFHPHQCACVCVMGKLNPGMCMIPNGLQFADAGGGHL